MRKLADLKLIFVVIFLLLAIAIQNSENFQLRDFDDGVSETKANVRGSVSGKSSTKIRYPFRKLEKVETSVEDDDTEENDNDEIE